MTDFFFLQSFRKGLNAYLTKFAYKNASTGWLSAHGCLLLHIHVHVHVLIRWALTDDLWACLEESSQKPVTEVMSTWTKQMGYPVISVEGKQVGPRV